MSERGDYRKLIRTAIRFGCVVEHHGRHAKLMFPDGSHVPYTTSNEGSPKTFTALRTKLRAKGVPV